MEFLLPVLLVLGMLVCLAILWDWILLAAIIVVIYIPLKLLQGMLIVLLAVLEAFFGEAEPQTYYVRYTRYLPPEPLEDAVPKTPPPAPSMEAAAPLPGEKDKDVDKDKFAYV